MAASQSARDRLDAEPGLVRQPPSTETRSDVLGLNIAEVVSVRPVTSGLHD